MNKKAYIGESLVNIWAIILIVLVIIGFWFLFQISGLTKRGIEQIIESEGISESNKVLIDYLRTDVDGEKMNFADLIALSSLKNDFGLLKDKTEEFMEENDLCFDLVINLFDILGLESAFGRAGGLEAKVKPRISCSKAKIGGMKAYRDKKESYAFIPVLSKSIMLELILYE